MNDIVSGVLYTFYRIRSKIEFYFDGKEYTQTEVSEGNVSVKYKGYACTYSTDGVLSDEQHIYANRNGHYKAFTARNTHHVFLKIKINKL